LPSSQLDNVERWLIHENFDFKEIKSPENNFHISIKHLGGFGNIVDVFQPKKQANVVVIGTKASLKNNQNARYLKFSQDEKDNFEKKVATFCNSIHAVHKLLSEDGKRKIGVYIVLDKQELFNQESLIDSIMKVTEMGDKTAHFLMKTF